VGSDCSGLESLLLALQSLGVPYAHMFSSDIEAHCRETLRHNYGNNFVLYEDATKRKVETMPPVDVYHAGFPCQPYSLQGCHGGLEDERSLPVLTAIFAYISYHKPRLVVLENVKGLVVSHKDVLDMILKKLHGFGYDVHWRVLNAKDYGVVPCNNFSVRLELGTCKVRLDLLTSVCRGTCPECQEGQVVHSILLDKQS
jgi:DNA (cytosine-5)-methyltransferase 1